MPLDTIEKSDVLNWDSKEDIADTLEKRGLERTSLGEEDEIVMELDEDKFVAIVAAKDEESPSDYNSRMTSTRQTQVVSTEDFEEFTFTTRRRAWDKHGQIKYNRWQIEKEQFRPGGEANTALEKLNGIEHGDSQSINQLYETKKVVNEFYDKFESIRADMVHKVSGIPEDEGEKKQNYAQTIFDRLIFLHFIQEKKLLDYNQDYLEENHDKVIENGGDVYEEFYKPLFFKWLATDQEHPDDTLPYLNGGLFTETDVEREYEDVRLGEDTEETNKLFTEILDFLGDWNWHADERLDIVDPNRLSPELLGHIFEKTVNQKEMGAYYTPEEITHFMSRNTIQPYILDRINEEFDKNYEEIDELFKIPDEVEEEDENSVVIGDVDEIEREEIEHLYFEVLQDLKVLDPAVGSGAFLLAAQEVLIDIYMSALQYFQKLDEKASWETTERIQDLVTELENNAAKTSAEKSMHAKRQIILNNLYGVDIDKGATEICKLRLWLSIVADLEKGDDPHKVETLPNIDFNIRQGNSLIGFTEPIEKAMNDDIEDNASQARYSQFTEDAIYKKYDDIIDKIEIYKEHEKAGNGKKAKKARRTAFELLDEYREDPHDKILQQFHGNGIDIDLEGLKEYSPFHWVLEFAEVYSKGGFDVVIANPPYIRIQEMKDTQPEIVKYLKESSEYETPYYNYDIAIPFLERCKGLLNENGKLSFIMTNKWLQARYGGKLRELLAEEQSVYELIDFTDQQVFEGITTYVLSIFVDNEAHEAIGYSEIDEIGGNLGERILESQRRETNDKIKSFDASYETLSESPWSFVTKEEGNILKEISGKSDLSDTADRIFQGCITGKDPIFILSKREEKDEEIIAYSEALEKEVSLEKEIVRPLLKGDEFSKWLTKESDKLVLFPYRVEDNEADLIEKEVMRESYPKAWDYIKQNEEKLKGRERGKWKDVEQWHAFSRKQNIGQFDQEKIMTSVLNKSSKFSLDRDDDHVFVGGGNAGGYGVTLPESSDLSYEYLLGVLNSRLLEWNLQKISSKFRGNYYSYGKKYIENLPIESGENELIETLSATCIDLEKEEEDNSDKIRKLEELLDLVIYELYLDHLDMNVTEKLEQEVSTLENDVQDFIEEIWDDNLKEFALEIYNNSKVQAIENGKLRENKLEE